MEADSLCVDGEEYRQEPFWVQVPREAIDGTMLVHLNNLPPESFMFVHSSDDVARLSPLLPKMDIAIFGRCGIGTFTLSDEELNKRPPSEVMADIQQGAASVWPEMRKQYLKK